MNRGMKRLRRRVTATQPDEASKHAQHEDLAAQSQNPFADLITFPFQNIAAFGYGPDGGGQNILNLQPVVPIHLNKRWNLLMRPILPISYTSWPATEAGLGDLNLEPFISPVTNRKLVWGVGSVLGSPHRNLRLSRHGKVDGRPGHRGLRNARSLDVLGHRQSAMVVRGGQRPGIR